MQLLQTHRHGQRGNVMLISLGTAIVLGILLAGYLIYTQSQTRSVELSQGWNTAIVLTEAGIEEALAHLNRNAPYFDPAEGTNNLACNGWTDVGNGCYRGPRRFLGSNYYDVSIVLLGSTPVINSTGFVYMPSLYASTPQTMFAAAGVIPGAFYQTRAVKINTKIDSLFSVAMAAVYWIDLNGKNVQTDSFDSADPNYSDGGLYPADPAKQKDNGDVVTSGTVIDSLSIGNAKIKGQAKTGPAGTLTIGPNGSVGTKAWVEGGNKGIQPGRSANDMNVVFPLPTLPPGPYYLPIKGNYLINGVTYDYVLSSGKYVMGTVGLGICRIYVAGDAILYVTGSINMTGGDVIRIAPTGASLRIYMGGATASVGGNGIINESGNAANFYYFGLAANTSLSFAGNASFTGCIYAPNADFTLGGGGNDTYDFVGASVTRTVKMNGHFNFHYDENLARVGGHRGFIPTKWQEQ